MTARRRLSTVAKFGCGPRVPALYSCAMTESVAPSIEHVGRFLADHHGMKVRGLEPLHGGFWSTDTASARKNSCCGCRTRARGSRWTVPPPASHAKPSRSPRVGPRTRPALPAYRRTGTPTRRPLPGTTRPHRSRSTRSLTGKRGLGALFRLAILGVSPARETRPEEMK